MQLRSVRFIPRNDDSLAEVEIQSATRQSALSDLQRLLHTMGLCVTHARARVAGGELYERVTVAERDGAPLSSDRYFEVQDHLLCHFIQPAA